MDSESKIQYEIFRWYWNNYCLPRRQNRQMIFHVPNQNQYKLLNIGVYPGVSDLVLVHNGKVIFMEVKEPEKGKQSDSQKIFEAHCKQSGLAYFVVHSLDEFKTIIFGL